MPSSVTVTIYLGSGMEGVLLEERIVKRCQKEKKSVSEFVKALIEKELKGESK